MAKFFKAVSTVLCFLCAAVFALVYIADQSIPDEFTATSYSDLETNGMLVLDLNETEKSDIKDAQYSIDVSILDLIPVKSSVLRLDKRKYVVVGGNVIGLKLYTKGVSVVGIQDIECCDGKANPAKKAGIQKGDSIINIDGTEITSCTQVATIFSKSDGKTMIIRCLRDGKEYETQFTTVKSSADGAYKAGMWIRDSAAGIGTMTYYDSDNGIFASLGHAVCDIDTGKCVNISKGECVRAEITGCNKGISGQAGELCGSFVHGELGTVLFNCDKGTYGRLSITETNAEKIPVAAVCEIKTGAAQIISTVDGNGKQTFDIEITKIYTPSENENRCMAIKITDSRLIELTGGIVQGMSGSPIIQNGMLVGAVTHVFVNDPTQGYAIFAQRMVDCSDAAAEFITDSAA